jgi:hypothetical protein
MKKLAVGLLFVLWTPLAAAISPYVNGNGVAGGDLEQAMRQVERKLEAAGFEVVGDFRPAGLDGYGVIVVTEQGILDAIASIGGASIAGAGIRVGVKADGSVSYIHPDYWYRAYFGKAFEQHAAAVEDLDARLRQALGAKGQFGGEVPADKLPDYRYAFGLEQFKDESMLKRHASFDAAIEAIESNLSRNVHNTRMVYKVVLADKQLAVFGVALEDRSTGDAAWVRRLVPDHIAALPYEVYIVDNEVYALHPRFRIALSWPALTMGTFLKIGNTPTEILATMTAVAGGVYRAQSEWGEQGFY